MIGYAGTAILPMQLGELIRVYIVSRRESLSYSLVFGSIAIERVFDFLSVLAVLGIVLVAGQGVPDVMRSAGYVVAVGCAAALLMTALLVTRTDFILRVLGALAGWMPPHVRNKILEQLRLVAEGFQVLRHPGLLFKVAANSIVQWLLMGICIWFSLRAVGISVPPAGAATVLIATIVGISLPTSPGYIGNIQIAFTVGLMPYDIPTGTAIAASIYYHVLAYVSVIITGFFFIHRYGYNFGQLRQDAADSAPADPPGGVSGSGLPRG